MGGRKRSVVQTTGVPKISGFINLHNWRILLTDNVIMEMVDFCFLNGPKSLLDDATWDGLIVCLRKQVSNLTILWHVFSWKQLSHYNIFFPRVLR